uniref:Microfibril associated protein 4 n=1 Tax=Salarias fasciatus TaxID=181472 RepID=A0A672G452_SALFA
MATCLPTTRPRSCHEVEQSVSLPNEVYTIYPTRFDLKGVKVHDLISLSYPNSSHLSSMFNGAVHFYQPWESYRNGFGDPAGEYWLGLETLHQLTQDGNYQLRVDLEDFDGNRVYALYDSFSVDAECDGYALHVSGFRDGGAGDSLAYHDGMKFSTFDRDQDASNSNCAQRFLGGFWYNMCYHTNPNGIYHHLVAVEGQLVLGEEHRDDGPSSSVNPEHVLSFQSVKLMF